jgi:biopolymer transport protein ExbB
LARLYDYFLRGGWIMWPLLLLSIAAVAIVVERAWALWRENSDPEGTETALKEGWAGGGAPGLSDAAKSRGTAVAALVAAGLAHAEDDRATQQAALETYGNELVGRLEAPLQWLRAIGEVAPLLGFLGTVVGMIAAFDAIVAQGTGDPKIVAAGISTAMITTAGGLCVAVPAYVCHSLLSSRLDRIAGTLDRAAHALLVLLRREEAAA